MVDGFRVFIRLLFSDELVILFMKMTASRSPMSHINCFQGFMEHRKLDNDKT